MSFIGSNFLPIPVFFPHLLLHLLVVQTNLSEIFHLPVEKKGINYATNKSMIKYSEDAIIEDKNCSNWKKQ